jgi:5'-nucleotidase
LASLPALAACRRASKKEGQCKRATAKHDRRPGDAPLRHVARRGPRRRVGAAGRGPSAATARRADGSGWTDEFDLIITGSCKPAFIVDRSRPIYRCDIKTGTLSNTDSPHGECAEEYLAREGRSFQGGNYTHLHDMLGVVNGSQILYVGDHIYADIVRSKRTLGWRTMLIVPELEAEVDQQCAPETVALTAEIEERRRRRDELDEWIDRLTRDLVCGERRSERAGAAAAAERDRARVEMEGARAEIMELVEKLHARFHPIWGQLLKSGPQNSRFAEQVENYACLYTSKATNLLLVSPEFYWRAMQDLMPHDRFQDSPMTRLLTTRRTKMLAEMNMSPNGKEAVKKQ